MIAGKEHASTIRRPAQGIIIGLTLHQRNLAAPINREQEDIARWRTFFYRSAINDVTSIWREKHLLGQTKIPVTQCLDNSHRAISNGDHRDPETRTFFKPRQNVLTIG